MRAVVITGAGRGFCAGQDLTEFRDLDRDVGEHLEATYHPNVRAIRALEKPVIAAVNGAAAGARALARLRLRLPDRRRLGGFVPGFVGIGLVPDSGGSYFLARLLGPARAFSWMTLEPQADRRRGARLGPRRRGRRGRRARSPRAAELAADLRGRADPRDRADEAPLRPRRERHARRAARARGRAPDRGDADGRLPRGRRRLPREAPAAVHRSLTPVSTVDYHTGGEPFRIVTGGVPPLEGRTILDKRRFAAEHLDHVRRLLVFEPRGHADMYGCFVTEPEDDGADLGVVFFHNAGYSTACGHGTIALVTWAIESGRIDAGRRGEVVVDVPSGRLRTVGARRRGPGRLGAVPQRAGVRSRARAAQRPAARWTSPSAAPSTPPLEERVEPGRAAAADRARPGDQGRPRARTRDRPPARAGAARRLRRDLLAGGGSRRR